MQRTLRLLFSAVAFYSGCAREVAPWYITRDRLLAIVAEGGGSAVTCPNYLPKASEDPDLDQLCFQTSKGFDEYAKGLIAALPVKPGVDPYEEFSWTVNEGAAYGDLCDVDIVKNEKPYIFRSPATASGAGGAHFWIFNRSRCKDATMTTIMITTIE